METRHTLISTVINHHGIGSALPVCVCVSVCVCVCGGALLLLGQGSDIRAAVIRSYSVSITQADECSWQRLQTNESHSRESNPQRRAERSPEMHCVCECVCVSVSVCVCV